MSFYLYRFYNIYFIFSSFLYLLYSQFSLYFQIFSSFCIFRVYIMKFLFFLNSQFFTYIFAYSQVFYIFHIFRFYYIFYILKFSIFSLLLCFSYVLYFELPLPFTKSFLSRKYLSTGLYDGADNCVSHTNDVEGLMIFLVWYLPEWMNILRRSLFETAINFAHSNDH